MTDQPVIALIGFGEVGQILATDLEMAGVRNLTAFDLKFTDLDCDPSRAVRNLSILAKSSAADAVRGADLILCAVTAAADLDAARSVVSAIRPGAIYLDVNSASPVTKRTAAAVIDGAGGRYVEAAVMSPILPRGIASPMLLGGPHAQAFLSLAGPLGFSADIVSEKIGQASATKMCRSVVIKGIEALLTESLLAARRHGVKARVLRSLNDLIPAGDWPKLAHYMISRSSGHGARRAEEMREAARTVQEARVVPLMSHAIAARQGWAAGQKNALVQRSLGEMLDAILTNIDGQEGEAPSQARALRKHA